MKKAVLGLLWIILICSLFMSFRFTVNAAMFEGWEIEDGGGHYSESDGIMRVWGAVGGNEPLIFYREVDPETDFEFSLQVNATVLQGFSVMLRSDLPFAGSTHGVNLDLSSREGGSVYLARWTGSWIWTYFATDIQLNTWYTLKMTVQKTPFTIKAEAFSENGTSLGSFIASDMTNINFDSIRYVGFGVLESGGDYYVKNIQAFNMPTPSPTPTPTPTPTPEPKPKPNLSVSCKSATSSSGFRIEIKGKISYNGNGFANAPISLAYSLSAGTSWQELTLVNSDSDGSFLAVWFPSVTGNYMIRANWAGNATFSDVNATVNLAVLPYAEQNVFSVTSNSTVTDLKFNSNSRELSFKVDGPQGTTGYADVYIAKSLVDDITKLKVYVDNDKVDYSAEVEDDSWVIHFTYTHSTHSVLVSFEQTEETSFFETTLGIATVMGIIAVVVAVVFVVLLRRKGKKTN